MWGIWELYQYNYHMFTHIYSQLLTPRLSKTEKIANVKSYKSKAKDFLKTINELMAFKYNPVLVLFII